MSMESVLEVKPRTNQRLILRARLPELVRSQAPQEMLGTLHISFQRGDCAAGLGTKKIHQVIQASLALYLYAKKDCQILKFFLAV